MDPGSTEVDLWRFKRTLPPPVTPRGIEGLHSMDRIQIAAGTMIVAKDFQPFIDATHHQFRQEDIRYIPSENVM
jgi:hypothetical protein